MIAFSIKKKPVFDTMPKIVFFVIIVLFFYVSFNLHGKKIVNN